MDTIVRQGGKMSEPKYQHIVRSLQEKIRKGVYGPARSCPRVQFRVKAGIYDRTGNVKVMGEGSIRSPGRCWVGTPGLWRKRREGIHRIRLVSIGEHTEKSEGKDYSVLWDEPFSVDVSKILAPKRQNVLAVRVHNAVLNGGIRYPIYLVLSDRPCGVAELAQAVNVLGKKRP